MHRFCVTFCKGGTYIVTHFLLDATPTPTPHSNELVYIRHDVRVQLGQNPQHVVEQIVAFVLVELAEFAEYQVQPLNFHHLFVAQLLFFVG